jgi:hypothetical protein
MFCIPALAVSAAFSVAEIKRWKKTSLDNSPKTSKKFFGIIIGSIVIGSIFNFLGINAVDMLFISAVINGIIIIPNLFMLNHLLTAHVKIKKPGFRFTLVLSWVLLSLIVSVPLIYLIISLI